MSRTTVGLVGLVAGVCLYAIGIGSALGADPDKPMLDGKTFAGTLVSQADGKTYDENIIFEKGMMRSTACEALGFRAGPYTVTKEGDKTMVKGTLKNAQGEVNEIEATIQDKMLTGTLTVRKADGSVADTMALKAAKAMSKEKSEHPAKTEHPAKKEHPHQTEHPR